MPNTSKPIKVAASVVQDINAKNVKHRRRFCRVEGCTRIVKSQGVCQRHGAKPRLCKVQGCGKQAQGNFDKMCKAHFKEMKRMTTPIPKVDASNLPVGPEGYSVYDNVLPLSIAYIPTPGTWNPLVAHLKAGFDQLKPPAWHRNEERRARGLIPIENPAAQLEAWERELVWMEILVLTGAPKASFRHLARAWGRDKGFHKVLAQFICDRQGDVRRKPRQPNKAETMAKEMTNMATTSDPFSDDALMLDDYGDEDNLFADDVFNFTVEEFEVITSKWSNVHADHAVSSESTLDTPAESLPSMTLEEEEEEPSSLMAVATDGLASQYHPQPPQDQHQQLAQSQQQQQQQQGIIPPEVHHQEPQPELIPQNDHHAPNHPFLE